MKMTLGAFIAHLRKEKGLTQKQLSEILNVSDKTVSHWEREESSPDISLLPLLADTFSITVDELLRGEKINTACETDIRNEALHIKNGSDSFYKFKQKNIISSLLSVILGFCGTFVLCLLNYIYYFPYEFHYTVKIISGILLALSILLQGALAIFAWITYSGYINKNKKEAEKQSCLRLTVFTFYSAFFFLFALIGSADPISVWGNFAALVAFCPPTALIIICTELLLRKKGILPKDPKWPEPRRNRLKLKLICTALACLLLWGALFANEEYHPYNAIYKHAQYVEFTDRKAFNEYIETPVAPPKEKYEDKYQIPYDIEFYRETENGTERCNTFYRNEEDLEYMLFFNYGNKEVLKIRTTDGNGFPVKCYTHSALIEAEKKAEPEIKAVKICLFALYPVSVAVAFCVYFAIKKKKGL